MNKDNKEFCDLLTSLRSKHTFEVKFTNDKIEKFSPLTTAQLKNLIKTVVDTSLTQIEFNSATVAVMKECYQGMDVTILNDLTIADKLLFLIETRINSISSSITIEDGEDKVIIDLNKIKEKLTKAIEDNKATFVDHPINSDEVTLTIGLPTLKTELQVDEEIYKTLKLDSDNQEQVRKLLGEAFVVELAKVVKSITIGEKTLNTSELPFSERQKTVENLPALLIQQVINYVENYKKILNACLVIDDHSLPIDGSLFSLQ
jgi:hypothetical protein